MTFKQKIENGIWPSKEEFLVIYMQNINREQICAHFGFSVSTYKKIRKYYNLPPKKRVIMVPFSDERKMAIQETLRQKYGEKGSIQRQEFYKTCTEKAKRTCLAKYGVENPSSVLEFQKKRKETLIQRYGVDNPMKNKDIQRKAWLTDIKKYGQYHISLPEIQEKSQRTILEKYHTQNIWKVPSILEKRNATNLKRYGHTCVLCNPIIREKGYLKMFNQGQNAVLSSSQQIHINDLFGGILNYPCGYYHIDCFLESDNIGVEYSGAGHNLAVKMGRYTESEFLGKEKARRQYFKNKKIPIIEFISMKDLLPSDEILLEYLKQAKNFFNQGGLYYQINLDDNSIYYE